MKVSRCLGFTFGGKDNGNSKRKATGEELCRSPWGITSYKMHSSHDAISASELWTDLSQKGLLSSSDIGKMSGRQF